MSNIIKQLFSYNFDLFKSDIAGALGVTAISIPQVMAFALIAGVNPIYGLFTFIVSNIIFSFLGKSNYIIVGPTNMVCVTIATGLGALEIVSPDNYFQMVLLLTFLMGFFQSILAFLKIAELVKYISKTVIIGITTGVSLIIISGQLEDLLEITFPSAVGNVVINFYNVFLQIPETNIHALLMGLSTMVIILIIRKFFPALPSFLMGIIISTMMVPLLGLQDSFQLIGSIETGFPTFQIPSFELDVLVSLSSTALSIAILGFTQVLSITQIMEEKTGDEIDLNKEFLSQGLMNMICSFFSSFAVTASFSRSFTNLESGAKTKISALFSALSVLIFIILFGNFIKLIPLPSLAGVIILVAVFMFDLEEIKNCFKVTRTDAIIFSATFLTTILTPRLDYAIYFGVLVSGIMVLKNTSNINYSHMQFDEDKERSFSEEEIEKVKDENYIVINFSGSLYFNTAENLKEVFQDSFQKGKVFVIRMRRVEELDLTAVKEIEIFVDMVKKSKGEVILSGIDQDIYKVLDQLGIIDKIGQENVFFADEDIFQSTKRAIDLAEHKVENGIEEN